MKFCTMCGAPYEEGTKFCRQCGNSLQPPVYTEPKVQKPVNESAVFYESMVEQPATENSAKPKKEKKKCKHKGLFIFLSIFVALIGIAAALFFFTDALELITGHGNHRIITTHEDYYYDNELSSSWSNIYDGSDVVREESDDWVETYTYDGKHNLVSFTEEYTYDDETVKTHYSVNTYVEDGLTYFQFFDEDDYYCWTSVIDDHGLAVQRLDDNERVTFEREIEYNFFGRITSVHTVYNHYDDENSTEPDNTTWEDYSVEYDGNTIIFRVIDSNNKDYIGDYFVWTYERTNFW